MNKSFLKLIEQIHQKNCVLFLGPDISQSAHSKKGLPTSWELVDELARRCNYRGRYQMLPQIAQIYAHRLGEEDLVYFLQNRLDDSQFEPLPIHEIIAHLRIPAIVYTGWDLLLERALTKQDVSFRVVSGSQDLGHRQRFETTIYKPYGSISSPKSLILTQQQQFKIFNQERPLLGELSALLSNHWLLMIGYAIDYDSVFMQLYNQIRQRQQNLPPAFVVQSTRHADEVAFWETLDIRSIFTDPVRFMHVMVQKVAENEGRVLDLPSIERLSEAEAMTRQDLEAQTAVMNQVLDRFGINELVEQSDIPLLSAEQVRDLEAMRDAYERLSYGLADLAESAAMWLRQGNIEYARQNYDTAEKYYRRAIAAQPDMAEAYHNLHFTYLAQSSQLEAAGLVEKSRAKLDEALVAYKTAVELDPLLDLLPREYQIEAILGQGGMGVVYRATCMVDGDSKTVAVKLLRRTHMYNEKASMRFRREAILLQRLQNQHIVKYIDSRQYKGRNFLVMEFLGEQTLATFLKEKKQLSVDRANEIIQQVGNALELAHQEGIIHRDIKPSNIFLHDERAKVIDFGLAADLEAGQPSIVGLATGTIQYMSPEQRMGLEIDARTDLFSLATVFFEALSGHHPGEGTYRPLSQLVNGINPSLDIVVEKARKINTDERYQTIGEFCHELQQVVAIQPAAQNVAFWRRALAWLQTAITTVTQNYWYLLVIISILVGQTISSQMTSISAILASRAIGLAIWNVFLISIFTIPFISWLAKTTQYAHLMFYTPFIGTVTGLVTTLTAWTLLNSPISKSDPIGYVDYVVAGLIVNGFVALVVMLFTVLGTAGIVRFSVRRSLRPQTTALLVYGWDVLLWTFLLTISILAIIRSLSIV